MTGAKITLDQNYGELERALNGLVDFGENPFALLDDIGGQMVAATQDRFYKGVGPDGRAWKTSQRAAATGGRTLIKSENLVILINHIVSASEVEWGSDLDYAAIHQFGGAAGRNGSTVLPARPYLGINDEDEQAIESTVYEYIEAAARLN